MCSFLNTFIQNLFVFLCSFPFNTGKHFNRCKRLHPILAQVFRVMHFRAYLKEYADIPPDLRAQFQELHDNPSPDLIQNLVWFWLGWASMVKEQPSGWCT